MKETSSFVPAFQKYKFKLPFEFSGLLHIRYTLTHWCSAHVWQPIPSTADPVLPVTRPRGTWWTTAHGVTKELDMT